MSLFLWDTLLWVAQQRALHWLQQQRTAWVDTYTVGLAAALDKRFGWNLRLPLRTYLRKAQGEVAFFAPFPMGPPPSRTSLHRLSPPSQAYAALLWAPQWGWNPAAEKLLQTWWQDKVGYGITHAYLVARHLFQKGFHLAIIDTILREAPFYLRQVAHHHRLCTDVAWEHLALWAESQSFREELYLTLREAVQYQLEDGSFSGDCSEKGSLHTTFLAAWALSAYLFPLRR